MKYWIQLYKLLILTVAPLVGAWIEIAHISCRGHGYCVAPLVGAWIEMSPPITSKVFLNVAPLVGAWIEMSFKYAYLKDDNVAPLVGAWIEIADCIANNFALWSLPSWERGLKSLTLSIYSSVVLSLPSWERGLKCQKKYPLVLYARRSPRGSVD